MLRECVFGGCPLACVRVVPIPAVAAASVLHSDVVGGFVAGDVGLLYLFGELNSC